MTDIKFGLRGTKHDRSNFIVSQGPNWAVDPFNPANAPAWNGEVYPGNFGGDLGGNFPKNVWMVSLTDETLKGNGGNAYLKPIVSNNYDATIQWYYAPRALLSAGLFVMDMKSYVGYGKYRATFINATQSERTGTPVFNEYEITAPVNVGATIKGIELAAQVPIGAGLGVDCNLTLADAKQAFGSYPAVAINTPSNPCDVLGASKTTYNVGAFYETDRFNARIGWSWRPSYLAAQDRGTPLYQDDVGSLSVSANYSITPNLVASFSGQNLDNPVLKNYIFNRDMPARFYSNGAQYYMGIRYTY